MIAFLTFSVTAGQRTNGIGASDSPLWARANASSTYNQQFRQSASRSASPPTSQQDISNVSPSCVPSRTSSLHNTSYSGNNYIPFSRESAHATAGYSTKPDTSQADALQASLAAIKRSSQQAIPCPEDSLPPSRHSENEAYMSYGFDPSGFVTTPGSHSRQQSRLSISSGMPTSYNLPQPASRSQSYSFNPQDDQSQLTFEALRIQAIRDAVHATVNSSGHRASVPQLNSPAPSQPNWPDYHNAGGFGLSATNFQEPRRESVTSMHNSSLNSPRTFGASRQAESWQSPTTLDPESLSRLQRAQRNTMTRQSTQSSYMDPAAGLQIYDNPLLQQMPSFSMPFQSYGYQTGQQFFPPSGPAGMVPRSGRSQDLTVGIRCPELEEFRRSSKSNRKWELKVGQRRLIYCPYLLTNFSECVWSCG